MQIIVQIGFAVGYSETCRIEAFLNGNKFTWNKVDGVYDGHFTTQTSKRGQTTYFLKQLECSSGDILKLSTSVFLKGRGFDEERTRLIEFMIDENAEHHDFEISKVGDKKFPLVSGKVVLMQSRTKLEDRIEAGENLIRDARDAVK